jgi:hypothetical protein
MILISKKPIALATVAIMALGLAGCNKASDNRFTKNIFFFIDNFFTIFLLFCILSPFIAQ